jgi:hypothetical protein
MTNPNGAPPGKYYNAATNSYVLSPPGTYSPGGLTAPITDPSGTYSAAGASAPTLDPSGTYSSPYALDRLVIVWQQNTPANVVLSFHSAIEVENYYGVTSPEASLAKQFFAGYANTPATLSFTRQGLGQRPHLLGANISSLNTTKLQGISGSLAIAFNGYNYSGTVNLAGVTSFAQAGLRVQAAIDKNLPIAATTTGSSIKAETVKFTGYFRNAQLTVTSVQSGAVQIGGHVFGKGVLHYDATNNQIIYQHSGTPGRTGNYSCFATIGNVTTPEAMTETYGILTIGSITSGKIAIGDEVTGTGVPPLTAIIANLGGGKWLINNAVNLSGDFTITAPPLTVKNNFNVGATQNNEFFEVQPNGAFGFDYSPSTLGYMTGTAADALGLSRASRAILSSPGGQHPSIAQMMDNIIRNETDQFGNPVHFGSFQTNEPRLVPKFAIWAASAAGAGYQLISSSSTTPPAGSSLPVTDPTGTYSPAGASAPTLGAPNHVPNIGTTEAAFDAAVNAIPTSTAIKNEAKQFEANVWGSDSYSKFVAPDGRGLEFWIETPTLQIDVQVEPTPSKLPAGLTQSESVFQSEINAVEPDKLVASTLYNDIHLAYGGSLGSGAAVMTDGTTAFGSVYEPTTMTTMMVHPRF